MFQLKSYRSQILTHSSETCGSTHQSLFLPIEFIKEKNSDKNIITIKLTSLRTEDYQVNKTSVYGQRTTRVYGQRTTRVYGQRTTKFPRPQSC